MESLIHSGIPVVGIYTQYISILLVKTMKIEVGNYYQTLKYTDEFMIIEAVGMGRGDRILKIRCTSQRKGICVNKGSTSLCPTCSLAQNVGCCKFSTFHTKAKRIPKAKGILLLGELDERI